jgi:hypothetical protein
MSQPDIYLKNRQNSHDYEGRDIGSVSSLENGMREVRERLFVRGGLGGSWAPIVIRPRK